MDVSQEVFRAIFNAKRSPEEIHAIKAQLAEPFEEEDVKWKPQTIRNMSGTKKGQAAAYADPRAYSDRLNTVVGPDGWCQIVLGTVITSPFPKKVSRRNEDEKFVDVVKILTTVGVGIIGMGFHTDVGES